MQLDLELILPDEQDESGRFERLAEAVRGVRGVGQVHLRRAGARLELCVHHDPAEVAPAQLIAAVKAAGAAVAERYHQRAWLVVGMDSGQSASAIEAAVARVHGVLTASVAYGAARLVVEYDATTIDPAAIERTVAALGFQLKQASPGHAEAHGDHEEGLAPRLELPLSGSAGALILAGVGAGWFGLPELVATVLFVAAAVAGGVLPVRTALASLRERQFDIEVLMVLAATGAAIAGAWFEASLLLFLFGLGHALEHRAMERARGAIEALGKLRPETARVRRSGSVREVPVGELVRGDVVVVRPGDRLPADGVVRDGTSSVDQSSITGESIPVPKQAGDPVFAGTLNGDGQLDVVVTRASTESVIAKVVDLVAQAEAQKSPIQRFTARFERIMVPIVLLGAAALSVGLVAAGAAPRDAALRGIAVLVAASPCALAISTPAAVLSAVARAARDGVLFKGGAHLEALASVRALAFDKTGTLTVGKPSLVSVLLAPGGDERLLLATAAAAEATSSHPIARAVVEGATARGVSPPPASEGEIVHGRGIRAVVAGEAVTIGNLALFEGIEAPDWVLRAVDQLESAGQSTMIVRAGEHWLGVLGVADTLRPEARGALTALRAMGVRRTVMLSGDNQRVARGIAREVGIDDALAPLLPEGKVAALKDLLAAGPTGMVGDGVNDAPALASASVGIAMGGVGSDVALQTADVVLMSEDLRTLPWAIGLARAASRAVRQNLAVSLGVSAILVVAAIAGWTGMSEAMVLHEGSTLVVTANGLRLLGHRARGPT